MTQTKQPPINPERFNPLYVNVIIRRYEADSDQAAVLVETGESFIELEARRAAEAA